MAPHSSTLAWKIPWMEESCRLQSMGLLRVRHDWATSLSLFTFMHWRRKWVITTSGWANSQILTDAIYFSLHFLSLTLALLQMSWLCPDYSVRWSGCWIGLTPTVLWHRNQSLFIPCVLELLQNNSESLSLTWGKWMPSLRSCFMHVMPWLYPFIWKWCFFPLNVYNIFFCTLLCSFSLMILSKIGIQ